MRSMSRKDSIQVYSGISKLPAGHASDVLIPGAMVLEGGAWRGIYTQGALDFYMQNDINMTATIGVSAGAMSGLNYVSGQIGRSARINLGQRHNPEYYGVPAMMKNHGITGFQFVLHDYNETDPLDTKTFNLPQRRFLAVATDIETGEAVYFEKGQVPDMEKCIQASATVPFMSKPVEIEGRLYLDGGCAVKIPIQWALDQGYEKIIVIRTRDKSYRKTDGGLPESLIHFNYHKYPQLEKKLCLETELYNELCDRIDALEKEGRIFVLAPSKPVEIERFESDMEKLGELYWQGYYDARNTFQDLQKYLAE